MDANKKRILWITRTAVLTALLIVLQAATAPLGLTLVTGSLVNMMLVISVMTCGLSSGLTVALISPVVAKLLGIGPFWSLIPFIAVGNCVIILAWRFIANGGVPDAAHSILRSIAALVAGAAGKFLVLYVSIVMIMVPLVLQLPEKQAAVISATFSFSQLFTALIGGAVAIAILPAIRKAVASLRK